MDMSGDMPRQVWVEIYSEDGELLERIEARVGGGSIATEFPAFPAGTRGRLRETWVYADGTRSGGSLGDLEELPTEAVVRIAEVG